MIEVGMLRDVMIHPALTVSPETSVRQAARLMEQFGCSFLPVVRSGRAVGVVTTTDLALRTLIETDSPASIPVRRVMTEPAIALPVDAEVDDASILMRQAGVRRLVVEDAEGRLAGVVGLSDLAEYMDDSSVAKTVRKLGDDPWGHAGIPPSRLK